MSKAALPSYGSLLWTQISFLLGKHLEKRTAGSYGRCVFEFYKKLPDLSPKWLCHFVLPPAMYERSSSSTSLPSHAVVSPSIALSLTKMSF